MAGTCGYGEGLSDSVSAGNFLTSCKVYWFASEEGLCSMEEVSGLVYLVQTRLVAVSCELGKKTFRFHKSWGIC